jgi:anaerobic selenocysteine-containing dehydrogenase
MAEPRERALAIFADLSHEKKDQLKVISRRTNYMINSWFHNVASLKRPKHRNNPLYIHPQDASRHNLDDGARVRVYNSNGEVVTAVALDESLTPGTVAITHGWGYSGEAMKTASEYVGSNANNLLPSGPGSYEKFSNQAFMTGIPVEIEAV